jgi:hypothetical protein
MVTPDVGRPCLSQATCAQIYFVSVQKLRAFRNPMFQFQNWDSVCGVQPNGPFKLSISPVDLDKIGLPVPRRPNLRPNLMGLVLKLSHWLEFQSL